MISFDTICSIATALSNAGIGIIRISGPDAVAVAERIFVNKLHKKCFSSYQTHTVHYGFIVDSNDEIIDEVMVLLMKGPNSYTREDTVEISCHGGVLMVRRIMDRVLEEGVRAAQPGEFTKRAFLNGRIDLSEAEAVMDLIHAENALSMKNSVNQLKGSVSTYINELRKEILFETAFIESALDDPEHISLDGYPEKLDGVCISLLQKFEKLIRSFESGKILKEGISTVIVGKPNAGKSSVLNEILGEERAIVTDIAGTTRDVLQESIQIGSLSLNLVDTAGIRETEDVIEAMGVDRAVKCAEEADLILYIIDGSSDLSEEDRKIAELAKDKVCVVIVNKSDRDSLFDDNDILNLFGEGTSFEDTIFSKAKKIENSEIYVIHTSALYHKGFDLLFDLIEHLFLSGIASYNDEIILTNIRQKQEITSALESIKKVRFSIESGLPEDFFTIDLMDAYAFLGRITGEEISEDLVNEIFSKFCMGK